MKLQPFRTDLFPQSIQRLEEYKESSEGPLQVLVLAESNFEIGLLTKSNLDKSGLTNARVLCSFESKTLADFAKQRYPMEDRNLKVIDNQSLFHSSLEDLKFDIIVIDFRVLTPQKTNDFISFKRFLKPHGFFSSQQAPNKTLNNQIILIGSSTGGTSVIKDLLCDLPPWIPPILIVQHMPDKGTQRFAHSLNEQCLIHVQELQKKELLRYGQAYLAKSGSHMKLSFGHDSNKVLQLAVEPSDEPPKNSFKPSVDILFESACQNFLDTKIKAVLLTGMGSDGALGLLKIRENKGETWAQNAESCVVFGMPKAAIELNAAQKILSPKEMKALLFDSLY